MTQPTFIEIGGRRFVRRELVQIRREQLKAAAKAVQPTLFELRDDTRPSCERTAAKRYLEPFKSPGKSEDEGKTTTRLFARATPVFAAEQVDGYQAPAIDVPATIITPIEQADLFVAATGAAISHGGSRAFYRPSTDSIQLPPREAFTGSATSTPAESYYSTLCHELTHWTSAQTRCNRQLGKRFGDDAYAMEELVAELGAAFLCADLGITDASRAGMRSISTIGFAC